MAEVVFGEVSLRDGSGQEENVMAVIREALGSSRSLQDFKSNIDYDFGQTRVFGGFDEGKLVCMNVFMRMLFSCDGEQLVAYQSGFSATANSHRGRGLWPKLMVFAENQLMDLGAAFIFGYPNPVSHPLFIKKLHYHCMDLYTMVAPRVPFWPQIYLDRSTPVDHSGVLKPDLQGNIAWKRRESGAMLTYSAEGSFLWGKVRKAKRLSIDMPFLEIGGFDLSSAETLVGLLNGAMAQAGVRFFHLSLNRENEYFPMFSHWREKVAPVIIKPLGAFSREKRKLNFFGGMRDTY